MIKVTVIGAAGRMGRRLVANIIESEDLVLKGALRAVRYLAQAPAGLYDMQQVLDLHA